MVQDSRHEAVKGPPLEPTAQRTTMLPETAPTPHLAT